MRWSVRFAFLGCAVLMIAAALLSFLPWVTVALVFALLGLSGDCWTWWRACRS